VPIAWLTHDKWVTGEQIFCSDLRKILLVNQRTADSACVHQRSNGFRSQSPNPFELIHVSRNFIDAPGRDRVFRNGPCIAAIFQRSTYSQSDRRLPVPSRSIDDSHKIVCQVREAGDGLTFAPAALTKKPAELHRQVYSVLGMAIQ